jgi:hypothetical protein
MVDRLLVRLPIEEWLVYEQPQGTACRPARRGGEERPLLGLRRQDVSPGKCARLRARAFALLSLPTGRAPPLIGPMGSAVAVGISAVLTGYSVLTA